MQERELDDINSLRCVAIAGGYSKGVLFRPKSWVWRFGGLEIEMGDVLCLRSGRI